MTRRLSVYAVVCTLLVSCATDARSDTKDPEKRQYSDGAFVTSVLNESNGDWLFEISIESAHNTICIDATTLPLGQGYKGEYFDVRGDMNKPLIPKYDIVFTLPAEQETISPTFFRLRKYEQVSFMVNISENFETEGVERLSILFPLRFANCDDVDQMSTIYILEQTKF